MKNSASSRPRHVLTTYAVEQLAKQLVPRYSQKPVSAAVRRKLQALERNCRFTPKSRRLFEELLGRIGVASTQGISLPIIDQPFLVSRRASPGELSIGAHIAPIRGRADYRRRADRRVGSLSSRGGGARSWPARRPHRS